MDRLWWFKVPDAWAMINNVSSALLNENSILLYHPYAIPWRNTFVQAVKDEVRENNSAKSFESIQNIADPGKYLLNEYCKTEKRATYRPIKGYASFFAESDDIVVHNKYFWVLMNTNEEINAWTTFVAEYYKRRPSDKDSATFILECTGDTIPQKRKGIELINVDNLINEYDKTVFATLVAAELNEPPLLKNYLTELVVSFAGNDIELMAEMISCYRKLITFPYETMKNLAFDFIHADGTSIDVLLNEIEIEHFVWKSQIKIVYPLLEEFRKSFVEKHAAEVKRGLPIEGANGEQIYEPEEVELGGLLYLAGKRTFILQEQEYNQLVKFRDARNTLSHLGILSWSNIQALFH